MYTVQVSRYKGSYKTRYQFDNWNEACFWYSGINIGNGYNKRLVDPNGKVVARQMSY